MAIIFGGHPPVEQSIALQTREANDIENYQDQELTYNELNMYRGFGRSYPHVTLRSDSTPFYNCHGLTFASRRTGIHSAEMIRRIITDDKYELVEHDRDVLPGDIILYVAEDGDIEHSGVVVSRPQPDLYIPEICSKWGKGKEVIHRANYCPYTFAFHQYYRIIR